jgi:NAD(P)-dependent dehydrogenase (short-subunit alcohol dehydrogenase family)
MPVKSLPDLSGKVYVVTGANTGIGLATARALAGAGARVLAAARSHERMQPARESIIADTGNKQVETVALDLGSLASVRRAAHDILERAERIDALINNAGVAGQRGLTSDGFELHFGVNHLGHFLLTELLLDRLRASAPSRIAIVSSKQHHQARGIDFDAVRRKTPSITGMREYAVSKLANILHGRELARRLEGTGVTTYSLHPGVVASDAWRRMPQPIRGLIKLFMVSTEEGAATSLYCATSPDAADQSGLYYDNCAARKPSRPARDDALMDELHKRSIAWTAE